MRQMGISIILVLLLATSGSAQNHKRAPIATYSIVARDSLTGEIGVAVQSHWFSVGSAVPWAEAGVGAVATQSFFDLSYGPLGLTLMRMGKSEQDALNALVSIDAGKAGRQVAMIDSQGRVAAFTGQKTVPEAGHVVGCQYSIQANMMENAISWRAMASAYESAEGDLAERLLLALEAAEDEGGDIRGRQSAALIIVSATSTGRLWEDRLYDLRVEDHPYPVTELRRLVQMQRAYNKLNEGGMLLAIQDTTQAIAAYNEATSLVDDEATNGELAFWTGIDLVNAGLIEEAISFLARAYQQDPRWEAYLSRLPAADVIPDDEDFIKRLIQTMKSTQR